MTYLAIVISQLALLLTFCHCRNTHSRRCEDITIDTCKEIGYNKTLFPNYFDHKTQEDAGHEIYQFHPLIKVNCSQELKQFLCSLYVPPCTIIGEIIPPCRSLCMKSRDGCELLMHKFGFEWPEKFQCEKFPVSGKCFGQNETEAARKL